MFNFLKKKKVEDSTSIVDTKLIDEIIEPKLIKEKKNNWFNRLKGGLGKTRKKFNSLFGIISIDAAWLDELEDALISSDVGSTATKEIMLNLRSYVKKHQPSGEELKLILKKQVSDMLKPLEKTFDIQDELTAVMMIGVNGAGKTTTIGKLCYHLQQHKQKIVLAAADTFRAAAKEQLQSWGSKNNVNVISNSGDPSSVAFDAIQSAKANKANVVIIDTAGRLPTQNHLLDELKKIKRVSEKSLGNPVQQILLVIDGNTGQNALQQIKVFNDAVGLTGLIITKLDGTAKGGAIIAMAKEFTIPVYFIGVGESLDDLQPFNSINFSNALFD
jgi:fused signal recognition particle receptor